MQRKTINSNMPKSHIFLKKKFSPTSSRGELKPLNVASCDVY